MKTCKNCGIEFETKRETQEYCSQKCRQQYKNLYRKYKPQPYPIPEGPEYEGCYWDGKIFVARITKGTRGNNIRFYSLNLDEAVAKRREWLRENHSGQLVKKIAIMCAKSGYSPKEIGEMLIKMGE